MKRSILLMGAILGVLALAGLGVFLWQNSQKIRVSGKIGNYQITLVNETALTEYLDGLSFWTKVKSLSVKDGKKARLSLEFTTEDQKWLPVYTSEQKLIKSVGYSYKEPMILVKLQFVPELIDAMVAVKQADSQLSEGVLTDLCLITKQLIDDSLISKCQALAKEAVAGKGAIFKVEKVTVKKMTGFRLVKEAWAGCSGGSYSCGLVTTTCTCSGASWNSCSSQGSLCYTDFGGNKYYCSCDTDCVGSFESFACTNTAMNPSNCSCSNCGLCSAGNCNSSWGCTTCDNGCGSVGSYCSNSGYWNDCDNWCTGTIQQNCNASAHCANAGTYDDPNGCGTCAAGSKQQDCSGSGSVCNGQPYADPNGCGNCTGTKQQNCNASAHCANAGTYADPNGCGTCAAGSKQQNCNASAHCISGGNYADPNECGTCIPTKPNVNSDWNAWVPPTCSPFCGQNRTRTCNNLRQCAGVNNCNVGTGTTACASTNCGDPSPPTSIFPDNPSWNDPYVVSTSTINLTWAGPLTPAGFNSFEIRVDDLGDGTTFSGCNATTPGNYCASLSSATHGLIYPTAAMGGATLVVGHEYYWWIHAYDPINCAGVGTCSGDNGWSDQVGGYFKVNAPPAGGGLVIKSKLNPVVAETGDRNQICDTVRFNDDRTAIFKVTVGDADGAADVEKIFLSFNRNGYSGEPELILDCINMSTDIACSVANPGGGEVALGIATTIVSGINVTVQWPVTFPESSYEGRTYGLKVDAADKYGAILVANPNRSLKLWDCKVAVRGTIYNGSDAPFATPLCPNNGFTTPAGVGMSFSSLMLGDELMSPPSFGMNSYGSHELVWGKDYNNVTLNSDFNGGLPLLRRIGNKSEGVGYTNCGNLLTLDNDAVWPYDANPSLRADLSSVMNQKPWYQVSSGGILSSGAIKSMVPLTCLLLVGCTNALSISGTNGNNGLVAAGGPISNETGCGGCTAGNPNDWFSTGKNMTDNTINYENLKKEYFDKLGIGTTLEGDRASVDLASLTGVVFIKGNLTIDVNKSVSPGTFLMVGVSGSVIIAETASRFDGILVADGSVTTTGVSGTQLQINGSVYAGDGFVNDRSLGPGAANNKKPSVKINYRPDFVFSMPAELTKSTYNWREGN